MTCDRTDSERSLPTVTRRTALAATAGGLLTNILSTPTTAQQNTRQRWTFETSGAVHASPTVVDRTVFVGSNDGNLYAVDFNTGDQEWSFDTDKDVQSSPTVVDGTVFVGSDDGNLYAVGADTGDRQWAFETNGAVQSSPTVVDGTVFVGSDDGSLHAVNAETGDQQWAFETNGAVRSSPTVPSIVDGTVFVGSDDGNLYAVGADTGDQQWAFETNGAVQSSPTVVDGTVFVGDKHGNFYAVDAAVGDQEWVSFLNGAAVYSSPTVVDGTVFVGSGDNGDGSLYAMSAETGDQQWAFETNGAVQSSPTVVNGMVFVGGLFFYFYAVDAETGDQQWAFETNEAINSSPTVVDGTVFVGSGDGNLYALDADVSGSSEGSRLFLGTLGHHDDWRYAGQSIEIPGTALYTSWIRNNPVLLVGGVGGLGTLVGGAYLLQRKRTSPEQSQEDTLTNASVDLPSGNTGTNEQSTTASDNKTADSESTADGHMTAAEAAFEKAVTAKSNDNYSEAADAYNEAISEYQEAINTLYSDSSVKRTEIKEAIKSAREDLDTVRDIQERNEAYQNISEILDTTTEKLDTAANHQAMRNSQSPHEKIETVERLLQNATTTVDKYGFDALAEELAEQKKRCAKIKEQLQTGDPPANVPTSPHLSLRYDYIEKSNLIGSGGNADVYRAKATTHTDKITLAMKEPRMSGTIDSETIDQLIDEAETWQQLDSHDHIVSVIDYGSAPLPWIGMEYMDSGDLSKRAGVVSFEETLWIALAITRGVRYAHKRGVAHLDLKPSNILFRSVEGAWDVPKIADWGLSKHLLEHSQSVEGMSPRYAAPEQLDSERFGQTDTVTDIYQLGTVLYELFTGEPPFDGHTYEVMNKIQSRTPEPPSERADIPEAIDEILLTALATKRADRYDDVLYIRDALQDLWNDYK